jgi:hypothetical protein
VGHEMVGQLIVVAIPRAGLTVNAKLDTRQYPINTKMIRTEEMGSVNLGSNALYGGMGLCHQAEPVYRMRRQVDLPGSCSPYISR